MGQETDMIRDSDIFGDTNPRKKLSQWHFPLKKKYYLQMKTEKEANIRL